MPNMEILTLLPNMEVLTVPTSFEIYFFFFPFSLFNSLLNNKEKTKKPKVAG
jgi:hypothetical protein